MSTKKQRFKDTIKDLKSDISSINKKLLYAAVLLFGLNISMVFPATSLGQIVFYNLTYDSNIAEQTRSAQPYLLENPAMGGGHFMSNALAVLSDEPANSSSSNDPKTETSPSAISNNALLSSANPITFISQKPRDSIETYTVQEGDTPSTIAASFGISLHTLLWANSLNDYSVIRPGDEITVLPVSGVLHRVKDGETVGAIASKYKANTEKIVAFNELPADGKISIGQKLVVPDGEMPSSRAVPRTRTAAISSHTPSSGWTNRFPYGQCTWYVAQKRYVPWSGHAKSWLINARAAGYQTGSHPQVGAIMVLTEGGWLGRVYGHVAYVEAVRGSWVTISEMNYTCYACKSVRTLNINDSRIKGYVY